MFNSINKNTWAAGNDVLFATPEAAKRFATEAGVEVDVTASDYPARGVVTGGRMDLTSSGAIRMAVEQLLMGQTKDENEVCTKQTYTSVCGRKKFH